MINEIISNLTDGQVWADQISFYEEITSTNDVLKEMAKNGAPHGTVLIADRQTGGRGRMGRSFLSPSGVGIYMSVLLRPNCIPSQLMHLTCAAACAACDAIEEAAGFRPGIKWINDIVYQKRKLAGILTEMSLDAQQHVDYAVIGIGINCCQEQQDFSPEIRDFAGSLAMFSDNPVNRAQVAAAMVDAFVLMDKMLLAKKAAIMEQYRKDCITLGQAVSVIRPDNAQPGTAIDVNEDGALIVAYPSGKTEAVNSGEVSVRGLYGYV